MAKALKLIAAAANVVLFATAVFVFQRYGFSSQADENFFIAIMAVTPVLNFLMMIAPPDSNKGSGENLVTLFIKRKTLEEKQKIERMKDKS